MNKKIKWIILAVLLLAVVGGGLYYILTKKYYPKVRDIAYLKLELTNDTAQVKAGVQVLNRIPFPIAIDSIHYSIEDGDTRLGWGQMTSSHTLPALGDKVLDFRMLLKFDKYRQHLQAQQDKDSIRIGMKADVFFDVPLLSPKSITLNQHLTVPVPKAPAMEIKELVVRSFSPQEGYSFLLRVDATNRDLPDLTLQDFAYDIQLGDSLKIIGQVDTTFHLQKGSKQVEIPLLLKTSDAIAVVSKLLSGNTNWKYKAQLQALVKSSHRLLDDVNLAVEKTGTLDIGGMGSGGDYLPTISQVKRLEIDSDEEQTRLQAALVIHNPSPVPFYIDSATYYIRHKGLVIASGKKEFGKVLPKAGDQQLNLRLLLDESAYQDFMKRVQGQEKATVEIALNLLYNLPNAKKQRIHIARQLQVPVQGQAAIQVTGLTVRELSPEKGASLLLHLKVRSSNLPNLTLRDLNYTLLLGQDLRITGHTSEPIQVSSDDAMVEVPIHLTTENVNQLLDKALKGSIEWNYDLQASALLQSTNDMIGPTRLNFDFNGKLEMGNGMGGTQLVPKITSIDTLNVALHFDTAWVALNINVMNPLPVAFHIDSLLLTLSNGQNIFAVGRNRIAKMLPAEGTQTAWLKVGINYGKWLAFKEQRQHQDSLSLNGAVTFVYQLEDLPQQRSTMQTTLHIPTPDTPVAKLQKMKLSGLSFRKGIVLEGLIEVKNLNIDKLEIRDLTYDACVENLLDVCGTVNRTYRVPHGSNIVRVPMSLGIGEAFRALIAKWTGKAKKRAIYLNASGTVTTSNPKLKSTFVRAEIWKEVMLFNRKKKASTSQPALAEN